MDFSEFFLHNKADVHFFLDLVLLILFHDVYF